MANKPVRQFKTHVAPAGARGYRTRRPIQKLEGSGNAVNPTQVGNAFVGKPSDDQGLKEHGEGAGGRLKIDPTIGISSAIQPYELLYQQRLAAANQPPPLPQPSTNIPLAVDPRDFGYIPQQPQPRLLPPTANTATIQPPPQRPITPPVYEQPNVGVDITPEQITLPPQQRIVQERPPVVDYGPITTPIERPTPIDMGYVEPEPIQVEYLQPQLEEPRPTPHYGELPVPQDEITNLIDNILPETPYVGSEVPYVAPEIPYEGSEDIIESSADILAPQPLPPRTLDDLVVQQQDPVGNVFAEPDFSWEDYHRGTDLGVGRGNIDEYVGGPIVGDPVGAAEIAEVLEEGTTSPVSDPTVTADITGEVDTGEVDTSYPGADVPLPTHDRGVPPAPEEVVVEEPAGPPIPDVEDQVVTEDTVVDTTGQEKTQTHAAATSPPVGGRKWLHTGDQDFAETRWQLFGAGQGDPIITDTPAVSGPVVNRETGEITTQPLTWWANQPAGSPVSPYGGTTVGGTDDTGTTTGGGSIGGGFTAEQVAEMAGGSITPVLDYLHPGATSDGQTVTFKDIGSVDDWIDGVIDLDPTLKGLNDLVYEKKDAEGNRVGWGNHALDGFNQITGTINKVFDFMGDPSKAEFTAAILEDFGMMPTKGSNLKEMASNFNKFRKEAGQMWETSEDKAWGRKWNDFTKTQEYGDMQPLGIFALLTNPPAALAMTANSLLYDFKNAAAGMFNDNPNYKGNMAQDILNGAFHFLGKAAKSVGSLFGKLGKEVGGKLNFTSKDMKKDPMEVSRQLLYASKNADPAVGDVRYELVKTLLENGVDVRFHNNAITFDKGIAKARIEDMKTVIDNLGLNASNIEIMAGTDGLDDFPELKAWLEARADQLRKQGKS